MVSKFDILKLKNLLKHFYTLTNIRITVFDDNFNEIVSYPSSISSFCRVIRTDKKAAANCTLCDQNACLQSKKSQKLFIYKCHAGLTEAITPIILNNLIIGYLFMGHISPYEDIEEGWQNILNYCKDYTIDLEALKSAFLDRRYLSNDYIYAASQIMNSVATYLCASHMATLRNDSFLVQLDKYIDSHLKDDLSVDIICDQFKISRTKLYQIAEDNFGIGISEYIKNQRIQKAKKLLIQTDLPINIVADSVGITDYNYFSKMFKKSVGITPKEYRSNNI